MTDDVWIAWTTARPLNRDLMYRWRIPETTICGMPLRPEWSDKLRLVGMGYSDNELWPPGSDWNGYVRSVHPRLEWRLAEPNEMATAEVDGVVTWHGLTLLPDPWTGRPPRVSGSKRWIGAAPFLVDAFSISHYFGTSYGWTDLAKMQAAWNTRAPMP